MSQVQQFDQGQYQSFPALKIGCVNLSGATSPTGCGFVFNGLIILDINIQTECTSTYGTNFSKINMLFVF